jgi:hypothetical protein
MKKKVLLGQNPIVVQAALKIVHGFYEKLTDYEKLQLKQLDLIEHKNVYFENGQWVGYIRNVITMFDETRDSDTQIVTKIDISKYRDNIIRIDKLIKLSTKEGVLFWGALNRYTIAIVRIEDENIEKYLLYKHTADGMELIKTFKKITVHINNDNK